MTDHPPIGGTLYRFTPANAAPVRIAVDAGRFIVCAETLINGAWQPCPDHPLVARVRAELGKPAP